MSRKHYVAMASALADTGAALETVLRIAAVCAADNPRFDRDRFIVAAGY